MRRTMQTVTPSGREQSGNYRAPLGGVNMWWMLLAGYALGVLSVVLITRSNCRSCARKWDEKHPTIAPFLS